jgi:hypothetical protein
MGIPEFVHYQPEIWRVHITNRCRLRRTIEACEEVMPIAQLAEAHFREHKRPLKIAVDEADWRFNNVAPDQVDFIRSSTSNCDDARCHIH